MTLECENSKISCSMSYPAFSDFRTDIAYLCGKGYGTCYNRMKEIYFNNKSDFFRLADRLEKIRISENVSSNIHDFLLMSDSDGRLSNEVCKELLFLVQKLPDKEYGVGDRVCEKRQIEIILLECIASNSDLIWF